jgi:hypothetical protein
MAKLARRWGNGMRCDRVTKVLINGLYIEEDETGEAKSAIARKIDRIVRDFAVARSRSLSDKPFNLLTRTRKKFFLKVI